MITKSKINGDYIEKGDPIDNDAIKEFLYFMIEDWDDDWYDHTGNYDFDRTTEINLQPWFVSDFLVLYKYFPNVQNVN